jgi:hypothetical protein
MQGKEGGVTYEVLSACEAGRQLEFVRHVVGLHDFAGPLSVDGVELVNLEPSGSCTGVGCGIVYGLEEVGDGTGVAGVVPLDLDGVTSAGLDGLDGGWVGGRNVAGHVVALDISDGAVGGWHPDADLVARGLIVDPELVEVLVGRDGRDKGSSEECFGEHIDDWR